MAQNKFLPNDMVFHMMQFCGFDQIAVLMMVSGEWFRESLKFGFEKSLYASKEFEEICNRPSALLITDLFMSLKTSDELFDCFSKTTYMTRLKSLRIFGRDEEIKTIGKLFKGRTLENLTYLEVDRVNIGDDGFKALSESPFIKNLKQLTSFWVGSSFLTAKYIAESENFSKLIDLNISYSQSNSEGTQYLCESPILSNLESISISQDANDTVMKMLAESLYLTKLQTIHLDRGYFSPEGLKEFLNSANARNITHMNFDFAELGNEGMKVIAESPNMINLQVLSVSNADVGDVGAQYLLESKYVKKLTHFTHHPDDPYYEGELISEEMECLLKKAFPNI